MWAILAFVVTFTISISKGKNSKERVSAVIDQGVGILLATLVTYTASKINFIEKTKKTTDNLLETADTLSKQLNVGTDQLTAVTEQIDTLTTRADTAINLLGTSANELVNLDASASEDIFSEFDNKDQNKLALQIDQAFRQHKKTWIRSGKNSDISFHPSVAYSWTNFVQTCVKEGQPNGKTDEVISSPKAYTKAVTTSCRNLLKMHPEEDITLFLVTAMLPEQFYNWPQMALTTQA